MRVSEVLSRVLHWRWLPFVLPVSITLLFVSAAVLFVPDSIDGSGAIEEGEEGESLGSKRDPATGLGSNGAQSENSGSASKASYKSRLPSSGRALRTASSRISRTPHNARVTPPRTGPGRSMSGGLALSPGGIHTSVGTVPPPGEANEPAAEAPPSPAADPAPDTAEPTE